MSITYLIKNIKPVVSAVTEGEGLVTDITFEFIATDESGTSESAKWDGHYFFIQRPVSEYSQDDYVAMANEIIAHNHLAEGLAARLLTRKTPTLAPFVPAVVVPPTEEQERQMYIGDVDNVIAAVIQSKTRFAMGYEEREKAAIAFLAPENKEPASEWITRFADNTGMSHKQAAELVLSQATKLRKALSDLDNLRMDKYLIAKALTIGEARNIHTRICYECGNIERSLA
jgi:hypothetical protein